MSELNEMLILATAITPITTGLTQVFKKATEIEGRYIPVFAVLIGLFLGGFATFLNVELYTRLWVGLISGLASVGLFEYQRDTRKNKEDKK